MPITWTEAKSNIASISVCGNLILNGGFETGDLSYWTWYGGGRVSIVLEEPYSGFYCLKYEGDTGWVEQRFNRAYPPIAGKFAFKLLGPVNHMSFKLASNVDEADMHIRKELVNGTWRGTLFAGNLHNYVYCDLPPEILEGWHVGRIVVYENGRFDVFIDGKKYLSHYTTKWFFDRVKLEVFGGTAYYDEVAAGCFCNLAVNGGFELGTFDFWDVAPDRGQVFLNNVDPYEGLYCLEWLFGEQPGRVLGHAITGFPAPLMPPYKLRLAFRSDGDAENSITFFGPKYPYTGSVIIKALDVGRTKDPGLAPYPAWNVVELNVDEEAKAELIINGVSKGIFDFSGVHPAAVGWYIYYYTEGIRASLDDFHFLVDPTIHDYKIVKLPSVSFFLFPSYTSKCVVYLDGGPLYKYLNEIGSVTLTSSINFSKAKIEFIKALRRIGCNVINPITDGGDWAIWHREDIPSLTEIFNWATAQGLKVYLFGYSAGGIITASEILRKGYASQYGATVIAAGLMKYGDWDFISIADQIKTHALLIAPVEDSLTYPGLLDFYNKALQSGYDVKLVKWNNGHDVFSNTSVDGRTLLEVTKDWFASH
jgi:hypothetical protein